MTDRPPRTHEERMALYQRQKAEVGEVVTGPGMSRFHDTKEDVRLRLDGQVYYPGQAASCGIGGQRWLSQTEQLRLREQRAMEEDERHERAMRNHPLEMLLYTPEQRRRFGYNF